jgi:hypothetical protein
MSEISVLCVNKNSIYKKLGVDCYDENRDVFTYDSYNSIIAHPPCRCFSKMRSFVTNPGSDFKIAQFVLSLLNSAPAGILEQPAGSKMQQFLGLGKPYYVDQFWFGYPIRKPTWLWFFGCKPGPLPYKLNPSLTNTYEFESMSKNQRSATPEPFAKWLINSIGGNYEKTV